MEHVEMKVAEASRFLALTRIVGATARDFDLLEKIEKTLDSCLLIKEQILYHTQSIEIELSRTKEIPHVIDEDGSIAESLETTRDLIGSIYARILRQCESVEASGHIDEDDGLIEAVHDVLNATADLHNAINSLCWVIGEHDANLERNLEGGPYSSADDLFAALGV